jgi:hypothetical protein
MTPFDQLTILCQMEENGFHLNCWNHLNCFILNGTNVVHLNGLNHLKCILSIWVEWSILDIYVKTIVWTMTCIVLFVSSVSTVSLPLKIPAHKNSKSFRGIVLVSRCSWKRFWLSVQHNFSIWQIVWKYRNSPFIRFRHMEDLVSFFGFVRLLFKSNSVACVYTSFYCFFVAVEVIPPEESLYFY